MFQIKYIAVMVQLCSTPPDNAKEDDNTWAIFMNEFRLYNIRRCGNNALKVMSNLGWFLHFISL